MEGIQVHNAGLFSKKKREESVASPEGEKRKKPFRFSPKKFFQYKVVKVLLVILIIAALGCAGISILAGQKVSEANLEVRTSTVERKTIQSSISSSGTLAAKDAYTITALVSGEVISADFEEGDQVEKGDVLYRIDTDNVDQKIESAETSLKRAQEKYEQAQEEYEDAAKNYRSLNYVSDESGYIQTLYVEAGDEIQPGSQIMDLYSDKIMVLKVPFLSSVADQIQVGDTAQVQILETQDTLQGTVTAVSDMERTLSGGAIVRTVSIEVENPGGLSEENTASAQINGINCSGDGAFSAKLSKTITAKYSGEIEQVVVEEGAYVEAGATLFTLTSESAQDELKNVTDTLENAEQSLEDAQTELENQQESLSDYEITAPISGQVIAKNVKAGDNLNNNSDSATMAIIYDMSALTFEMSVDELDVLNVEVGQKVEVTVDAFEGETFMGEVTNVSLVSSSSNGVTNYPVTVQMDEVGDLLPGMNVTGEIIIDEAEDVLAIPAQALQRGNVVYVKDDSVTETEGNVPAGFRSVEVGTGLISSDYVEIKSGLSEGDEVYIDPTSSTESTGMGMMGGMPAGGMGGAPGGMGGNAGGMGGPPGGGF